VKRVILRLFCHSSDEMDFFVTNPDKCSNYAVSTDIDHVFDFFKS
jgi:hypothetical protein